MTEEMFKLIVKETNEREILFSEFIGKTLESKISEDSKNEKNRLCEYGCGKDALFLLEFKNSKKWCCSEKKEKCTANIKVWNKGLTKESSEKVKQYSESKIGKPSWNSGLTKETDGRVKKISTSNTGKKNSKIHNEKIGKSNTGKKRTEEQNQKSSEYRKGKSSPTKGRKKSKISFYIKKYPEFIKLEYLEENPETKDLIVKCSVCSNKFSPSMNKISNRIKAIKNNELDKGLFYCSHGCKKIIESKKIKKTIKRKKRNSYIRHYIEFYPEFLKFEFLEENSETKDLIVRCSICNKKYIPVKREKISYRAEMIKLQKMNQGMFYCSEECKETFINEKRNEYEIYNRLVWKETHISVRDQWVKIKNIHLRGRKYKYQLDHKYSIIEGFKNKIDPKIIGHWKNLEVITDLENIRKLGKCSISLEQLKQEIIQTGDYRVRNNLINPILIKNKNKIKIL